MVQRRIGLSSRHHPGQLLTTVGGSKTQKLKLPSSVDAPPVSSDEDEDELALPGEFATPMTKSKEPSSRTKSLLDISGSSDDERHTRGDIKSTKFTADVPFSSQRSTRAKRGATAVVDGDDARSRASKKRIGSDSVANRVSAGSSQDLPGTAPSSSGEHLKDARGFTRIKRSKLTYKKRENSSQEQADANGTTPTQRPL